MSIRRGRLIRPLSHLLYLYYIIKLVYCKEVFSLPNFVNLADASGLEPKLTESESVVLPITPSTNLVDGAGIEPA